MAFDFGIVHSDTRRKCEMLYIVHQVVKEHNHGLHFDLSC